MAKIAFIGLGNMGGPMAINLVKKGHDVTGFDISKEAMATLTAAGGKAAATVLDTCKEAEVVITMLPSGKHVAEVLTVDFIKNLKLGTLLIESSTIDVATTRLVASLAAQHGCIMIDAPVSGGTAGAQNGTLTFIVGGTDHALKAAKPFLECMGKNIFHAGNSGAGQVAKICNNMLLSILMVGTSEALTLGVANGLDPGILSEIMQKSSGRNWALELYNPYPGVMENAPSSRKYAGGFAVDLMSKDLKLAEEASVQAQVSIPLGSMARNLYKKWGVEGNGKLDFSSIIQFLNKKNNNI
jgi:3-hydroxyisobutyrate dehydrogenase